MLGRIKSVVCIFVMAIIVSVEIVNKNLEIVYREDTPCTHLTFPSHGTHSRVWKEIYKGRAGEVYLFETIEGKHTKATVNPEKIEWPKAR